MSVQRRRKRKAGNILDYSFMENVGVVLHYSQIVMVRQLNVLETIIRVVMISQILNVSVNSSLTTFINSNQVSFEAVLSLTYSSNKVNQIDHLI